MIRHFITLVSVLALAFSSFSQSADFEEFDAYLRKMTEMQKFTGTVLLAEGNSVVFNKAYGPAVASGETPNQTDSEYLIGSITKTFTAVAILQLMEENKLALSDSLSKYVAIFPNADNINVRQLLSHRSGIKSYTDLSDMNQWKYDAITPAEIVEKVMDARPMFEPGEMYSYSNTNYILLGMIIEQVSGQDYSEYINEHILKPHGLEHTGMKYSKATNLSEGLEPKNGAWLPEPKVHPSVPFSAGALYSSADDMFKFSTTLFGGGFFKSGSTLDAMLNFDDGYYGLGVYADQTGNQIFIGHNGGIDGYSSVWKYFKDLDLHVIVLSNSFTSDNDDISLAALNAFRGLEITMPQEREPVELPKEKLKLMEGIYQLQENFNLTVFVQEKSLMARASGQGAFELFPVNDTSFFATAADIEVNFRQSGQENARALTLIQGGAQTFAKRIEDNRVPVELSQAELEVLEGSYELQQGFDIDVFVENGRLYAQGTGQEPFVLSAETRSKFYSINEGIELEFKFGEDGESKSLTLYQGGGSFDAPKKP